MSVNAHLSEDQLDGLKELTNIGLGSAAGVLNSMLSTHIELSVPTVKGLSFNELDNTLNNTADNSLSIVELSFHGDFGGSASLLFPPESACKLVSVVTGGGIPTKLSAIHIETLNEIGNIILNAVMGSFSNVLTLELRYTLPNYSETAPSELSEKLSEDNKSIVLLVETVFSANEINVDGHILLLFEASSFQALTDAIEKLTPGG